jgi:pyruvate,water dikinase
MHIQTPEKEPSMAELVVNLSNITLADLPKVGGKNASLGEMIHHLTKAGVKVPPGFATTSEAFHAFLAQDGLADRIHKRLQQVNVDDIQQLTAAGQEIRSWFDTTPLPKAMVDEITRSYHELEKQLGTPLSVAVRSSATAEDLPDASFAGQQETFLNVVGLDNVLKATRHVFASLYNDRAIAYRVHQGFEHAQVALSVGVQAMVRSDIAASGVMFTLDTESGFNDVVFITAAYGLGETVVQGSVNPDEFYVHKATLKAGRPAVIRRTLGSKKQKMIFSANDKSHTAVETVEVPHELQIQYCLTDKEIEQLARYALAIEAHYNRPMDIEWAKDGNNGEIFIVQARPETVKSRDGNQYIERYSLKKRGEVKAEGRAIGQRIGQGTVKILHGIAEMDKVKPGDVLVTDMTDPDWEPIMKRAAAIVTNRGGRTCHAAIIARELGIPAIVGCGDASERLKEGEAVTVSCAEGDTGYVYGGLLEFEHKHINVAEMPELPCKIMMNVGNPDRAFDFQRLPNAGIGLARLEFIINRMIGVHPHALLEYEKLPQDLKDIIHERIACYASPVDFYVEKLVEGISTLAAAFSPHPVIVRLSDFKSNEYANLIAGDRYEPHEENPMLGFRGASRYLDENFRNCFELECRALRKVYYEMGFHNVQVMVPFVRTPAEAEGVVKLLAQNGLQRGKDGLKIIMMCEIPANALLAEDFLQYFDGFSIGSNDLTQLTLGLDRDSGLIAKLFDERNPAVKALLHKAIATCRAENKYIGICGQGPSDYPDFAEWLVEQGINTISLNPDSVLETWLYLAERAKAVV